MMDAQQALAQAAALANAGRHAEAEALFRRLATAHSDQPVVLNALALFLMAKGETGEPEQLLRRAIAIEPANGGYRVNLGNLLCQRKAFAEAEPEYRAALALGPRDHDAHYNLGLVLEDLHRFDEAFAAHEAAVALRGDHHRALTRMGMIRRRTGALEDAVTLFDRAVAAKPDFFDAHYGRGDVLYALHRLEEAAAAQRRALELQPNRYEAHFALANTLLSAGKADDAALASFWRAAELKPDYADAHYGFSQLAWTMGRRDIHRNSYARARTVARPNADLLLQEARMLRLQSEFAEAEKLLRLAYQVAPQRADITAALGEVFMSARNWDESRRFFERALELEPTSTAHRRSLGVMLLHKGDALAARRAFEEMHARDPNDQSALALLALAHREAGDDAAYRRLMDFERYVRAYDIVLPSGFASTAAFNAALAEELDRLHTRKVEPFDQTLRGGSQTVGSLFDGPTRAVGLVRDSIAEAVASYIRELPDDPTHPMTGRTADDFSFAGSWSCRLASSGYHTNHVHPEGWISSAYYVHLPDAVEDETGRQGWLKFGESNLGLGARDKPARHERPAVGRLVLFPSYFWHGTVPFRSSDNRLTVAFDVVPGKQAPPATVKRY